MYPAGPGFPAGEPADEYPADAEPADGAGTGDTDTTGIVKVTVGEAELHAVQTTTSVVKPAGISEVAAGVESEPDAVTTVVVYDIVV